MRQQLHVVIRERHKFGLALECETRGQISGRSGGDYSHPTTDEWIVDNVLECGRFIKGTNWTKYKTAAVARGANPAHFVEDATHVRVTESATLPFLSLFDVVVINPFQNGGIAPRDVKRIKDLAAAAGQKPREGLTQRPPHIIFHGWKDDMPAGPHTSSLWAHYYDAIKAGNLFMEGTGPNSTNGALTCDPEETLAWPGGVVKDIFADPPTETPFGTVSGHNWHVDYTKATFATALAQAALDQWTDYWSAGGASAEPIDAYMAHDLVPHYPARAGTATNLPTIEDDVWYAATKKIPQAYYNALSRKSPTIGKLWTTFGYAADRAWPGLPQYVKTIGGIMYNYEWGTAVTDARFVLDIMGAIETRIPLLLGSNNPHASHTSLFTTAHLQWPLYLEMARTLDYAQNVYIASNNEIGYLHWNESMREV